MDRTQIFFLATGHQRPFLIAYQTPSLMSMERCHVLCSVLRTSFIFDQDNQSKLLSERVGTDRGELDSILIPYVASGFGVCSLKQISKIINYQTSLCSYDIWLIYRKYVCILNSPYTYAKFHIVHTGIETNVLIVCKFPFLNNCSMIQRT